MSDDPEFNKRFAEDLLHGADAICGHLNSLGFEMNVDGVYYAYRARTWPISKHGKFLLSTKSQLDRHARKIANCTS